MVTFVNLGKTNLDFPNKNTCIAFSTMIEFIVCTATINVESYMVDQIL